MVVSGAFGTVISWIFNCLGWIPVPILGMFIVVVLIKFADSVLGLWDRAMRVLGR